MLVAYNMAWAAGSKAEACHRRKEEKAAEGKEAVEQREDRLFEQRRREFT